mgnify:CR=1 FL=1
MTICLILVAKVRLFVEICKKRYTENDGCFLVSYNLQCRKAYVRVNLDVDEEGTIIPMLIRWKDGRVFQIEQLKYKCRASSNKVGGGGIRYTVMIRGKESFLFHEGNKWFVEAKEDNCS